MSDTAPVSARRDELQSYNALHLPTHLAQSGRTNDFIETLGGLKYIDFKCSFPNGVKLLIDDYDLIDLLNIKAKKQAARKPEAQGALDSETEAGLRLIQEGLRISAHTIANHRDQLPSQLYIRLLTTNNDVVLNLINQIRQQKTAPWLRPLRPSLPTTGGPLLQIVNGHNASVRSVIVTPDQKSIISIDCDNMLLIWNIATYQIISKISQVSWFSIPLISPDGKLLVFSTKANDDRQISIWNLDQMRCLFTLPGYKALVFLSEHILIASNQNCEKPDLIAWDLRTRVPLFVLPCLPGEEGVNSVAITSDRKWLVASMSIPFGTLKIWDITNQRLVFSRSAKSLFGTLTQTIENLICLPGNELVMGIVINDVQVWDIANGKLEYKIPEENTIESFLLLPEQQRLLCGCENGNITMWDMETRKKIGIVGKHHEAVNCLAFIPNSNTLISASNDHTLRFWRLDVKNAAIKSTSEDHAEQVNRVKVAPNNRFAVSIAGEEHGFINHYSADNSIRVWNLNNGQLLRVMNEHEGSVQRIALSPDNRYVFSGDQEGTLIVWDLAREKFLDKVEGMVAHSDPISSMTISDDGRLLISGDEDGSVYVWIVEAFVDPEFKKIAKKKQHGLQRVFRHPATLGMLKGHTGSVTKIIISPDEHYYTITEDDVSVKFWDLAYGGILQKEQKDHKVEAFISPQKCILSSKGELKIWNPLNDTFSTNIPGKGPLIVSADKLTAISSTSNENELQKVDLINGKSLGTLPGFDLTNAVWADKYVTSRLDSNTIILWSAISGEAIATFSADDPIQTWDTTANGQTICIGDITGKVHLLTLEQAQTQSKVVYQRNTRLDEKGASTEYNIAVETMIVESSTISTNVTKMDGATPSPQETDEATPPAAMPIAQVDPKATIPQTIQNVKKKPATEGYVQFGATVGPILGLMIALICSPIENIFWRALLGCFLGFTWSIIGLYPLVTSYGWDKLKEDPGQLLIVIFALGGAHIQTYWRRIGLVVGLIVGGWGSWAGGLFIGLLGGLLAGIISKMENN